MEIFKQTVSFKGTDNLLSMRIDTTNEKLVVSVTVDGQKKEAAYPLDALPDLTGFDPTDPDRVIELGISAANLGTFAQGFGGLALDGTLTGLRIVLRPQSAQGGWSEDAPFLALYFDWDLEANSTGKYLLEGGEVSSTTTAMVQVTTGFAALLPSDRDMQPHDLAVRLDVDSFGLTTGWMPLTLFLPKFDPTKHEPGTFDPAKLWEPLARWFRKLVDYEPDETEEMDEFDWDRDFPFDLSFPLGLRARKASISLAKAGATYRITAGIDGLILSWDGKILPWNTFKMALTWQGGTYVVKTTLTSKQYPDKTSDTDPYGFALPGGLLRAEADCWFIRLGLHVTSSGTKHFCFDALLEVGGLKISSSLSDTPLYETDLRLQLRDLSVMSAELTDVGFFEGADAINAIAEYQKHDAPRQSFATDLSNPPTDPANDTGLTLLDGDFRKGERVFIAWEQRGNQLLKSLAHTLLGTEAAGAIPEDADTLRAAIELAWFGDDTQLRLDWQQQAPAKIGAPMGSSTKSPTGTDCIAWDKLANGLHLPLGKDGVDLNVLEVPNPMPLSLPGLRLQLTQPSFHSLILRRDGEGSFDAAYVLGWTPDHLPKVPQALASARLGFSMAPEGDAGERQVIDNDQGDSFLTLGLGVAQKTPQALRIFGKREDGAPKFLQAHRPISRPMLSLIPPARTAPGPHDCPPRAATPLPPLALPFDAFETPRLDSDQDTWRLGLKFGAQKALLGLFGGEENRKVDFEITELCLVDDDDGGQDLLIKTSLTVALVEGFTATGNVTFRLDLDDMALSVADGAQLAMEVPATATIPGWARQMQLEDGADKYIYMEDDKSFFGFHMSALRRKADDEPQDPTIALFSATIKDGRFTLETPEGTNLLLRYDRLSEEGLNFLVSSLTLGPGGVDLDAEMLGSTLKLRGLQKPFTLERATLRIRNDEVQKVDVYGSGRMPELLNNTPAKVSFSMTQDKTTRDLQIGNFECTIGDGTTAIISKGTRLRFELTEVEIGATDGKNGQEQVFFFKISGSLTFKPEGSEFAGKLLEDFKDIRIEFTDAPLGDEFFDHVELMVTLTEPAEFKVFNLFDMEIRSIGFHPNFQGFDEPCGALIIGGQCKFAELGDVIKTDIQFHKIYLGCAKSGEVLPQVHCKGLRVDISTQGVRIAGRLDEYDDERITGFKGEGTVLIPGFPEISAAFAFTKIRANTGDSWKRAWFIAVEAARMSLQMGTLPLYLRQIGLGFGYRYTSTLIKEFESTDDLPELIRKMLAAVSAHHSLARIDSWAEDPEGKNQRPRFSIGFETVFSMASGHQGFGNYDAEAEKPLKSAIAQVLAFVRSDFTFMAAAKVWFPISMDDFFTDKKNMRRRPLALGFMGYSAPKSRLLIHAAKGKNPYLGDDNDPLPPQMKQALNSTHFEMTFLSEPGLIHSELGWVDRLVFPMEIGPLKGECRGGVLFRLERDVLVMGFYFSFRAGMNLGGGVNLGIVGMRVTARASFTCSVRLMASLYLSRPLNSKIYAAVGLDISVHFSVEAWLRIDAKFFKIHLDISFSLDLQILVALEVGWAGESSMGFKAQAQIVIGVFGRSLSARVSANLGGSNVDRAKLALAPYMSSYLEPGAIPPVPGVEMVTAERTAGFDPSGGPEGAPQDGLFALHAPDPAPQPGNAFAVAPGPVPASGPGLDPPPEPVEILPQDQPDPRLFNTAHAASAADKDGMRLWFVWITPNATEDLFYPVPAAQTGLLDYGKLTLPETPGGEVFHIDLAAAGNAEAHSQTWVKHEGSDPITLKLRADASANAQASDGGGGAAPQPVTLRDLLAGCYILEQATEEVAKNFPLNLPADGSVKLSYSIPESFGADQVVTDNRLLDPQSDARRSKRQLDPEDPYDRRLMRAIRNVDEDAPSPGEQAAGNEAFLMTGFMDDLKGMAASARIEDGKLVTDRILAARPTLTDLGMVICVRAKDCPAWIKSRPTPDTLDQEEVRKAYPKFTLISPAISPVKTQVEPLLLPCIDFAAADFAGDAAVGRDEVGHFDDDTLNVGWNLAWHGPAPMADLRGGVLTDPEDMLDHYQVDIFVAGEPEPIHQGKATPGDLIVTDDDASRKRVKLRYQFNLPLAELPQLRALTFSRRGDVHVHVSPVAQTGEAGKPMVVKLTYEPSLTPLPADDARLDLRFTDTADPGDSALTGQLSWRVLAPPTRPGVVPAARWELVLRPLTDLPLGAYPDEAVDRSDTGMMSISGDQPREGDLILALHRSGAYQSEPDTAPPDENDPRDPALQVIRLDLGPDGTDDLATLGRLFDHTGREITEGDPRYALAQGFFARTAATAANGAGWKLFLRAAAQPLDGVTLPTRGYSSLSRVALRLLLTTPSDKDAECPPADPANPPSDPAHMQELDHLEWIRRGQASVQLDSDLIEATTGPILEATFDLGKDPGDGSIDWSVGAMQGDDPLLTYISGAEPKRGVTLRWSAIPETSDLPQPYESWSAYRLHEARMDRLLSLDAKPETGFAPKWSFLREIRPIDPALARRSVTAFSKPETWWTRTPADTAQAVWTRLHEARRATQVTEGTSAGIGWYSWDESVLDWPAPLETITHILTDRMAKAGQPPFDLFRENRPQVAQDPVEDGDGDGGDDTPPTQDQALAQLAACHSLGTFFARRRLHPYLSLVVGYLGIMGAPQKQGSFTDEDGGDGAGPGLFEIEVTQPPAAGGDTPGTPPNPLDWLQQNTAETDPVGWSALSQIGLATSIALRDPLTGLHLSQKQLRLWIAKAEGPLNRLLDLAWPSLETTEGKALAQPLRTDLADLRAMRARHLGFDLPVQTVMTNRTFAAPAPLDGGDLAMVQMALRPQPVALTEDPVRYAVVRLAKAEGAAPPVPLDVINASRGQSSRHFGPQDPLRNLGAPRDVMLLRYRGAPLDLTTLDAFSVDDSLTPRGLRPVPLTSVTQPAAHSPFQRFPMSEEEWEKTEVAPGWAAHLTRFASYLARGFLVEDQTPDADGNLKPVATQLEELRDQILDDANLPKTYRTWGARFFRTAPIALDGEADHLFHPLRLGLAAPERDDPQRMAPDGQGRFTYTHEVQEDWATQRAFAIKAVPRYYAFDPESAPDRIGFGDGFGKADAYLPRVRAVDPPKLLAARLLTGAQDRQFHEVTLAEPAGRKLARASSALARKVEFDSLRHRHHLQFRHASWLAGLKKTGLVNAQPTLGQAVRAAETGATGLRDQDAGYLAKVPMARFGATRLQVPAEPFYFNHRVDFLAQAGLRRSSMVSATLPPPVPAPTRPGANDSDPVGHSNVVIPDASDDQFPANFLAVKTRWTKLTTGHALAAEIRDWTLPRVTAYRMRFPRLLESLPPAALDSHFAGENAPNSLGRLPDPNVRLELVERAAGSRTTVGFVEPRKGEDGTAGFDRLAVSKSHVLGALEVDASQWETGIHTTVPVARDHLAQALALPAASPALVRIPDTLVQPGNATPVDAGDWPINGTLGRLLPLLCRLEQVGTKSLQHLPLSGPKGLMQPHLQLDEEKRMDAKDVAVGLRLILDVNRRQAAAFAAMATARNAELTELIHTAAYVAVGAGFTDQATCIEGIASELQGKLNGDALGRLYLLRPDGDTRVEWIQLYPNWPGMTAQAGDRLVFIATGFTDDFSPDWAADAVVNEMRSCPATPTKPLPEPRLILALSQACSAMGATAIGVTTAEDLSVMAHWGNAQPVPWKKES